MKIIHVVHNFFPNIGGNPIQVYETARRQAKEHDVEVYTTDPKNQFKPYEEIEGMKVFRFPSFAPNNAYYISKSLYKALKHVQGDVLHVHSFLVATSLSAELAFRRKKNGFQKIVFTPYFHEVASTPFRTFLHKIYDHVQKSLFFWADYIICLTNHETQVLHKKFNVPLEKMHVIPAGLDYDDYDKFHSDSKEYDFEILYTGRLERYKNVQQVVFQLPKLIQKYPQKRIHFTVLGKGPYSHKLQEIIKKTKMADHVTLKGFVTREDLVKHYKRADVFVTLANYESFGITIVEAVAAGTPVIISQLPIANDVLRNGNGFMVTNFDQLPEKFDYIMNHKLDVQFDPHPYTWDTIEKQTTKLYLE